VFDARAEVPVAPECDCDDVHSPSHSNVSASSGKDSEPKHACQPGEAALAETVAQPVLIDRGLEPAASLEVKLVRSPFEGIGPLKKSQPLDQSICKDAPTPINLLDYLPETPQRDPQCTPMVDSGKQQEGSPQYSSQSGTRTQERACETINSTSTPEIRAESRKHQVLAKVAQEQANVRKDLFVFGKSPIRTPSRKKVDVNAPFKNGEVVEALLVEAVRK